MVKALWSIGFILGQLNTRKWHDYAVFVKSLRSSRECKPLTSLVHAQLVLNVNYLDNGFTGHRSSTKHLRYTKLFFF